MSAEHSPLPWKADGYHIRQNGSRGTRSIADICYTGPHHTPPDEYPLSCKLMDAANAEFIVRACNNHDALVIALRDILNNGGFKGLDSLVATQEVLAAATGKENA